VALSARFNDLVAVTAGTTFGMMIANVPAVLFGDVLSRKVPLKLVRSLAAASFVVLGLLALLKLDMGLMGG
jgi:putative Ca2+/H+ antiporter (TMEM165/GDT1 family)